MHVKKKSRNLPDVCIRNVNINLQSLCLFLFGVMLSYLKGKTKEAVYMDSCDSHGRSTYNDETDPDYLQVSV